MDIELLFAQFVNGMQYGSLLLLVSLGLSLTFGLGRVVNFAQGDLYALGAFFLLTLLSKVSFWLALVLLLPMMAILGYIMDLTLIRRIRSRPEIDTMLLTFGIGFVLIGSIEAGWGRTPFTVPTPDPFVGKVAIFGIQYPEYRLAAMVISILVAALLFIFLHYTRAGLAMRAAADDVDMAGYLGINTRALLSLVVALGSGMAALAGGLAAPIYTIMSTMGQGVIIDAFLANIIGGLGSLRGSILASFLIGIVRSIGGGYMAEWSVGLLFICVMGALLFRPTGLFGEGRVN
jgi:branched-chain amino acid transport system permease protein